MAVRMTVAGKYASVLMFGCPGSGKGTQGAVLGCFPNLVHLAMGDIFRALDKSSDIGKEFLSYSTQGQLVPDELTVRVFRRHVDDKTAKGQIDRGYHTLILDGIPRTPTQVELLKDVIEVRRIIHLVMEDREALIARLTARAAKSNRPDDADRKVIENRIAVYERETYPVLAAYPKLLVVEINADQHYLAVLRDIANTLADVIPAKL
jgi:adenylate kinase